MNSRPCVNTLSAVAGLIAVLALSTTAAFGQVPEKGSAKGMEKDFKVAPLKQFLPPAQWTALEATLGLTLDQADPPRPTRFESTPLDLEGDDLLDAAFARNPRLKMMEAEVRMAEATIALARKSRVPDFSLGLMAGVRAAPTMFRPQAGMTLVSASETKVGHDQCGDNGENHPSCCFNQRAAQPATQLRLPPGHPPVPGWTTDAPPESAPASSNTPAHSSR